MDAMRAMCAYVRAQRKRDATGNVDSSATKFRCDTLKQGDIEIAMGGDENLISYWTDSLETPAQCTRVRLPAHWRQRRELTRCGPFPRARCTAA